MTNPTMLSTVMPICLTLFGCSFNMFCLEAITRESPGCGNLVTFAQFLFITLRGFIFTSDFGRKKAMIPLQKYIKLVTIFFVVQVLNNYAFALGVPAPLHMIFRSGSLMASLLLNVTLAGRSYPWTKHVCVWVISIGIIMCTMASQKSQSMTEQTDSGNVATMSVGVLAMSVSLLLSAYMGLIQESMYKEFGKHPDESLYYNHLLPMPLFLFLSGDIITQIGVFNASPLNSEHTTFLPEVIPSLWVLLILNTLSQFMCIRSVFVLTTECTTLTVTLVVTLRKFISLIFSIWYFDNPFTAQHFAGTVLVFSATLIFTLYDQIVGLFRDATSNIGDKKKKS